MNKITLLFISLLLCLSQIAVSQEIANITIAFEEQSLRSALCELEEASRFEFVFQDEIPDTLLVASQRFENACLFRILDVLLANTEYSYAIIGSFRYNVIIYRLSKTIQSEESELFTVSGRVLSHNGRPTGASIIIKRENVAHTAREHSITSTNAGLEGFFEITVDNPNIYLIVLSAGYLPRVVHIKDAELIQLQRPTNEELILIRNIPLQ